MKYFCLFLLLFSTSTFGETVVNYDDGSTYTLKDNQEVYISTSNSVLFKRKIMSNKDTFFTAQQPWESRDYVPTPVDDMQPGSHLWCKTYVPWSEGLTFDMVMWQRACDTDNDGKYGCGDSQFDDSEDSGVCT